MFKICVAIYGKKIYMPDDYVDKDCLIDFSTVFEGNKPFDNDKAMCEMFATMFDPTLAEYHDMKLGTIAKGKYSVISVYYNDSKTPSYSMINIDGKLSDYFVGRGHNYQVSIEKADGSQKLVIPHIIASTPEIAYRKVCSDFLPSTEVFIVDIDKIGTNQAAGFSYTRELDNNGNIVRVNEHGTIYA